jgi:predicted esterase
MKKIVILAFISWIFCFSAYAQSTEQIYLWPGSVPGMTSEKSKSVLADDPHANSNLVMADAWMMQTLGKPIPTDAPEKLVSYLHELAARESNPLLKEHFESVARFTLDTTHGFEITLENMEEASRVLQFFENEGSKWENYVNGPRPLIIAFKSPSDGKYSYYNLFLPKNFDPDKTDYPFYMELHGSGGGSNDNPRKQLYMSLQPEVKGVTSQGFRKEGLYIYPWGRGDKGYRGIAEADIHEALADFDRRFNTDPRKQYIYGFSMGGGGSFRFSQSTIERWSAVGIYSGAIFNLREEEASLFKNTPLWMVWGDQEERIGKASRELRDLLLREGVDLYWKEIEGVGHSYLGEYQENLMNWFNTKKKELP